MEGNRRPSVDVLAALESDLDPLLQSWANVWPRRGHPAFQALNESLEAYAIAVCAVAGHEPALRLTEELQTATDSFRHHPIFIVGAPKSGTTLVRNLLDGHPQLVVLPSEGKYWTDFLRRFGRLEYSRQAGVLGRIWIERLINPVGQPPFWLLGRTEADGRNPYVDFIGYLNAWAQHLQEKGHGNLLLALVLAFYTVTRGSSEIHIAPIRWVEKTPLNELHIERILAGFPQARFVHVVRDPRAVASARKTINVLQGLERHPVLSDVWMLRRSFAGGLRNLQRLGTDRYHVLRYEELVHEPLEVLGSLAEFLGIVDHETLSRPTVGGRPASSNSAYSVLRIPGRIYEDAMRRFDGVLSPREHIVIGGGLHREVRSFGYDLPVPPRAALLAALAGSAVASMPFYLRDLAARLIYGRS